MNGRQIKFQAQKEPLSVIKIQSASSTSNQNIRQLNRINEQRQKISPDFFLSGSFSPQLANTRRQKTSSRFQKFFKKEIKTHENNIKKNPRVNLIENTQRLISDRQIKLQRYVLHSTKKLQILSESYQQQKKQMQSQHSKNNSYFVSLTSDQDPDNVSYKANDEKRKKSQECKRLWKGSTMKKRDSSFNGRFSVELEKYNHQKDIQNEEEFIQPNKLSLYQSLIYTKKLKAQNIAMPCLESSGRDYAKIDRSKFADEYYQKIGKNRQNYYQERQKQHSQFPRKRVDTNSPQVLTIHIKRSNNKFRGNLTQKFDKREYYQPRSMQLSNIFKRPNTTLNSRNRKNSEIEPW